MDSDESSRPASAIYDVASPRSSHEPATETLSEADATQEESAAAGAEPADVGAATQEEGAAAEAGPAGIGAGFMASLGALLGGNTVLPDTTENSGIAPGEGAINSPLPLHVQSSFLGELSKRFGGEDGPADLAATPPQPNFSIPLPPPMPDGTGGITIPAPPPLPSQADTHRAFLEKIGANVNGPNPMQMPFGGSAFAAELASGKDGLVSHESSELPVPAAPMATGFLGELNMKLRTRDSSNTEARMMALKATESKPVISTPTDALQAELQARLRKRAGENVGRDAFVPGTIAEESKPDSNTQKDTAAPADEDNVDGGDPSNANTDDESLNNDAPDPLPEESIQTQAPRQSAEYEKQAQQLKGRVATMLKSHQQSLEAASGVADKSSSIKVNL